MYEPFVEERIGEWAYWIKAREQIRQRREAGKPPPWHTDPVMATTRWCNVRRMDDKVSVWMMDNWFSPGDMYPREAIIAGLMARMINKPETLSYLTDGKPYSSWDYKKFYKRMYEVKASGETVFTNAYIINGASGGPKIDQVLNAIDTAYKMVAKDPRAPRLVVPVSMQQTALKLHCLPGVGSFISGQVVADLRWVLGEVSEQEDYGWWQDRMTWAPPGPGSSRGMKYLLGEISADGTVGRGADMNEKQFLKALRALIAIAQKHPKVGPIFKERRLEAHDIQNTLCETSKFIRVSYGLGRPKNFYEARK